MQPVFSCPLVSVVACGAARAPWAVFRWRDGKLACLHSGVETSSSAEAWLQTTTAAMQAAGRAGGGAMPLVLVLSAPLALLKHIKAPRVAPNRRDKVVRFEIEQNIPYAAAEVISDYVESGRDETGEALLLAIAKREVIAALCTAARDANFKVRLIVPSALAIRAGEELAAMPRGEAAVILNAGVDAATLLQVDGLRFAARAWLTRSVPQAGEGGADTFAERLVQEAGRSLVYFQREYGLKNPSCVVLAGSAAPHPGLSERLRARLQLPVQMLEMAGALEVADGSNALAGELPELAGAALLQLQPGRATLNLLPPALRRRAHLRQKRSWLVAAALLGLVALLPPLVHYHRLNGALEFRRAAMEAALGPERFRAARNRAAAEQLAVTRRQLDRLQAVQERRGAWLGLLADLQERFVTIEDVWLDGLRPIPATGTAPVKLAVSGRMLDKANPRAKVSPDTFTRLKVLLADLVDSPFVAAVESESFDNSQPGILKFELVLVTKPARPL